MVKKQMIIWDADGTIRRLSIRGLIATYSAIIISMGKNPNDFFIDTKSFLRWNKAYWQDRTAGQIDNQFVQLAKKLFHKNYDPHTALFPWVKEIATQLSKKYNLAILTSSTTLSIIKNLAEQELVHLFNPIIGSECVENLKPHTEGIEKILNQSDVSRDKCLIIGDSSDDLKAGKNAGISTGLVRWGMIAKGMEELEDLKKLEPDFVFEEPQDLLTLL